MTRTPHPRYLAALCFAATGTALVACAADGLFTVKAATGINLAFASMCSAEAAIPDGVGPVAVAFCPEEDKAEAAFVAQYTTKIGTDAGAPDAGVTVATEERTVPLLRMGVDGKLVHCAWSTPSAAPAAQRALLAMRSPVAILLPPSADAGAR